MHELITTLLDLVGLLLLVAAATALAAVLVGAPLALAVAGLGLLAVSWLLDRLSPARKRARR